MAEIGNLTQKQRRAIAALLSAPTVNAAAKDAGVGERTLHRWLEEPAFTAALAAAQGQAIAAAVRALAGLAEKAVATIHDAMTSPASTPGVRLRAAGMALDMLLRLKDAADFEKRLQALERGQDGTGT